MQDLRLEVPALSKIFAKLFWVSVKFNASICKDLRLEAKNCLRSMPRNQVFNCKSYKSYIFKCYPSTRHDPATSVADLVQKATRERMGPRQMLQLLKCEVV